MKKVYFIVLICLLYIFWQFRANYFVQYNGDAWFKKYQDSQYTRGDKSNFILSDSDTFALKGYLFVQKNVALTNFEPGHPPFASYLMGLSNLIFGNPLWANLIVGISFFLLFAFLVGQIAGPLIAVIFTLIFLFEPIMRSQFGESMLDIYQLLFALLALICYYRWWQNSQSKYIFISSLFVGLMLSSKFFLSGITLPVALIGGTTLSGQFKRFLTHVYSLISLVVGFLLGHLTFFLHDLSLLDFARYQRYVLNWWAGSPQTPAFQVWDMILFNRWHTWWDSFAIIPVAEWRLTWPLYIILGLSTILVTLVIKTKRTAFNFALWLWLSGLMFQLSFTAAFPRHLLLPFLPALLLIAYNFV